MAIEDLIANGIRPPQVEDMTTASARGLSLANAMQQRQMGQLELQQRQLQMDQTRALNDAYRGAVNIGPDGMADIDTGKLTTALGQSGHGSAIPTVLKGVQEYKKSSADLSDAQGKVAVLESDAAGALGSAVRQAKYDPNLFLTLAGHAVAAKHVDAQTVGPLVNQVQQAMQQDPTGESARQIVQRISDQLVAGSPKQRELDTAAQTAAARAQTSQTGADKFNVEKPGLEADVAQKQRASAAAQLGATTDPVAYTRKYDALSPELQKQFPPPEQFDAAKTPGAVRLIGMSADQQAQNSVRRTEANKLTSPAELAVVASDPARPQAERDAANAALKRLDAYQQAGRTVVNTGAGAVTEDDFKRSGEQYARTGIMPSLGMGGGQSRMKILHYGNEFARAAGMSPSDVVTMQAAYKGDTKSLESFQKQRDQIVSFEGTASKNIDQFLNLASQIPDRGIPWVNSPMRLLDEKLVGAPNMAAVNAARAVATNEIAKVTSGGSMSGVLSDAARQEVKDYNPKDATFAQTLAVVKVLKKDMQNRHETMDATLDDIKSRIGGSAPGPAAAPKATHRFNPKTGQIEAIQ